ncbi:hypothetical protein [Anaerorhabdus furcosa]|uniref:Uncharacterized protein n=1 Tax=Anaerorhabdus furcosa TaxID=118967 RepID=A0A1T4MN19_9FIRM|nr:hypothetical protein [Anaerorhabdus furcosa]SJZ68402.1 hypothetical protein SAMN02745191_1325 [Anaerorhabdus furcosa]
MKKIVLFVVTTMILLSSFNPIYAESSINNKELFLENNSQMKNIVIEDSSNYIDGDIEITIKFYSVEDGMNIIIERENDIIIAYDENGNQLARAQVTHTEATFIEKSLYLIEPRAAWSGWYFTGQDNVLINKITSVSATVIAGIILGSFPKKFGITTGALLSIAAEIKSYGDDSRRVYNKYYGSSYSTCNILSKGKVETFKNSNFTSLIGSVEGNYYWDGNPYDYTQPSACRELVGTYPY